MADLRIVDAPEIPTENITGEEKLPTGGSGNYSISLDSLADYTKTKKDLADNTSVDNKVNGARQELDAHIEDLLNPHQVTKGQIGLGNVDNTADADKPVSNSTQSAIISAVAQKADKTYVDNQLTLKANKTDVYTKSETYTKQESSDLVGSSISTALTPVNTSLDLAKRGIINRYDSSLTYNSGERAILTNADIVKSTIDWNTNDPNSNMTGWINESNAVKNRVVWFEDYVSDTTGSTDVTAEMQSLLDSHDGGIYAKETSIFKTSNTLFNRKNNRTVDFHNAKIVNKSNSRYAIVTISPSFTGSTDTELNAFVTERHYGEEVEGSHIKNLQYEMSPNTGGGANLGVGIIYGYRCYISNAEPTMTNGNAAEIRNSLACGVYKSKLLDHRSYSVFLFMSENCVVFGNEIKGGLDGVVIKMNRDGNPDVNHIITQNTFKDVGSLGYSISGGAVKESSTHPIYVANHQIVRGVKIYGNIFEGSTLIPKIGAHIYSESWEIYGNTFKCGGLAGTIISLGAEGTPTAGELLKGGHQVYGNFFYDVNSIGNTLVYSALNSKVFNNFMFNVKSRYMFYALKDRNNNPLEYADFYGNNFDKDCVVYCGDSGVHGLAVATQGVKNFRCHNNTGYIKAISASASKALTSIFSAAENTELYSNDITYSAAADITTLIAQSITGTGNLKRIDNQTITIDTTGASALSTVYGVNTTPTIKVTGKHTGNTYKLIGSATVSRAFVAGAAMIDDISNAYEGSWVNQILNNSGRPLQQTNIEVQSSAMPTSGNYKKGDYIRNTNPSISANTVIIGWLRITTGSNHVLNTDWVEIKQSTT